MQAEKLVRRLKRQRKGKVLVTLAKRFK